MEKGRCTKHESQSNQTRRQSETWRKVRGARGGQVDIYTTARWRKKRAAFLLKHPLCIDCQEEGRVTAATDVDHEVPHRGEMAIFWDESLWRARCHSHHSAKTIREAIHQRR